jgi:hypothetical protein
MQRIKAHSSVGYEIRGLYSYMLKRVVFLTLCAVMQTFFPQAVKITPQFCNYSNHK